MARKRWPLLAALTLAASISALLATSGADAAIRCGNPPHPCSTDLSLTLTPPSGQFYVGQEVPLTGTVSNAGPDGSSRQSVARLTLSGTGISGTPGSENQRHDCTGGCLFSAALPPVGGTGGLYVLQVAPGLGLIAVPPRVRLEAAGQITITGTIGARVPNGDPNLGNNTASVTVTALIGRCTSFLESPTPRATIIGTIGGDVIRGTADYDDLEGKAGDDCINGEAGDDWVDGGSGNDVLRGGPGKDIIKAGPGHDRVLGGTGDDEIHAIDKKRDLISCGPGDDSLTADSVDRFRGCEDVEVHRVHPRRKR